MEPYFKEKDTYIYRMKRYILADSPFQRNRKQELFSRCGLNVKAFILYSFNIIANDANDAHKYPTTQVSKQMRFFKTRVLCVSAAFSCFKAGSRQTIIFQKQN